MRKIELVTIGVLVLVGAATCPFIEDPRGKINYVGDTIADESSSLFDKMQQIETGAHVTTIVTAVVPTAIWLVAFLILRRRTPTFKDYSEFVASQKKDKQETETEENPALIRAKARAIYNQLKQDMIVAEGRVKWIPEEISKARARLTAAQMKEKRLEEELDKAVEERNAAESTLDDLEHDSHNLNNELRAIRQELKRLEEMI